MIIHKLFTPQNISSREFITNYSDARCGDTDGALTVYDHRVNCDYCLLLMFSDNSESNHVESDNQNEAF